MIDDHDSGDEHVDRDRPWRIAWGPTRSIFFCRPGRVAAPPEHDTGDEDDLHRLRSSIPFRSELRIRFA